MAQTRSLLLQKHCGRWPCGPTIIHPSIRCSTHTQHPCKHTHAASMQAHICSIHAAHMQHTCSTHALHMQHPCSIPSNIQHTHAAHLYHAAHMQHTCSIPSNMQHTCSIPSNMQHTLHLQQYRPTINDSTTDSDVSTIFFPGAVTTSVRWRHSNDCSTSTLPMSTVMLPEY